MKPMIISLKSGTVVLTAYQDVDGLRLGERIYYAATFTSREPCLVSGMVMQWAAVHELANRLRVQAEELDVLSGALSDGPTDDELARMAIAGGLRLAADADERNPNDAESARRDRGLSARDGTTK